MADFKLSLLMTAIMSCLITGCGGGGHHSSNNESQNSDATEVTPTSPSETPSETIAQQNSKLEVQVIDGYLTDLDVCIVNEKLECNDVFGKARTDENGKASFDLNDEQKKILTQMKSVKFKAVPKKGTNDFVLGKKTKTQNDMVLIGTKHFKTDNIESELSDEEASGKSFKLTPFTTIAEMILSAQSSDSDKYYETLQKIVDSLGSNIESIQSDYNQKGGDNADANIISLIAGELIANLNMLPKTDSEFLSTKDKDELLAIICENLRNIIKKYTEEITNDVLGVDGAVMDGADLSSSIEDKRKVLNSSFVSLSTGLADEWRCGVTKANEVWCWGNNAWNNLGNQEFTQSKLNFEKYTIEGTDALMYLNNNYSAEPQPVLIKNPDKKTDEDPEYIHLSGITKVATGNTHGCAITLNKEVYCWGGNYNGQLGIGEDGFMNTYKEPVGYASKVVTGKQNAKSGYLSNVVDLSLGQNHSCALTADGDIYCWGDNTALELGAAHEEDRMHRPEKIMSMDDYDISEYLWMIPYPVKVPAPEWVKFSSITQSGYWAHCALSTPETTDEEGHNLWCWGDDNRGLISSGNNKQYVQEIIDNWEDKIEWKGENSDDDRNYSPKTPWNWHYRESSGDWFPMFGQPITNIKSYNIAVNEICYDDEGSDCITVSWGWKPGDKGSSSELIEGKLVERKYYCKSSSDSIEMKNIKTIDITEFDSQLFFTTTDSENSDKILYMMYTDSVDSEGRKQGVWTIADSSTLDGERIKKVQLGVESIGRFVITEEGHLYGFGPQRYGILGTGVASEDWKSTRILMDKNNPDLKVLELSVNKRSVCASVKDENAEDQNKLDLFCWGSSTFGQLGFDNGDNDFSYGDVSTKWQDSGNELLDDPSRMKTTPKKVLTNFTFDD